MKDGDEKQAEQFVFVSYSSADESRVSLLIEKLSGAGINVWWDRDIPIGSPWRDVIQQKLDQAVCVLVIWTKSSIKSKFVRSEADPAMHGCPLRQVRLDADARIPVGFTEDQICDLTGWSGEQSPPLTVLIEVLKRDFQRGAMPVEGLWTIKTGSYDIKNAVRAAGELRKDGARLGSLAELASTNVTAADDLRAAFTEIDKTFRVVEEALLHFFEPLSTAGDLPVGPYLKLERDEFLQRVNAGRGHCGLLAVIYGKYRGLRDWLIGFAEERQVKEADAMFARLSMADNDAFERMVTIVKLLKNESRIVAAYLLSGQQSKARSRLIRARKALARLEDALSLARADMEALRARLGMPTTSSLAH